LYGGEDYNPIVSSVKVLSNGEVILMGYRSNSGTTYMDVWKYNFETEEKTVLVSSKRSIGITPELIAQLQSTGEFGGTGTAWAGWTETPAGLHIDGDDNIIIGIAWKLYRLNTNSSVSAIDSIDCIYGENVPAPGTVASITTLFTGAGPNVTLSAENTVVTGNTNTWGNSLAVLGDTLTGGVHCWQLELTSSSDYAMFGVCKASVNIANSGSSLDGDNEWLMYCNTGGLFGNGTNAASVVLGPSALAGAAVQGDRLGCRLDLDAGTLSFFKNGVPYGLVHTGVVGPVKRCVKLYGTSDTVTALSDVNWASDLSRSGNQSDDYLFFNKTFESDFWNPNKFYFYKYAQGYIYDLTTNTYELYINPDNITSGPMSPVNIYDTEVQSQYRKGTFTTRGRLDNVTNITGLGAPAMQEEEFKHMKSTVYGDLVFWRDSTSNDSGSNTLCFISFTGNAKATHKSNKLTISNSLDYTVDGMSFSSAANAIEITPTPLSSTAKKVEIRSTETAISGTAVISGGLRMGSMYLPRLTNTEITNLAGLEEGMVVFNTNTKKAQVYDGTAWQNMW
jgi:hypothetical protein